jgi:hypothetical protein
LARREHPACAAIAARLLPALGRFLTLHPALILVAEHAQPITNFVGHPKSFYCDEFMESHGFLLETCMYFPFVTAKNLVGFGAEHSDLMRAFPRLQMILVLAVDPALASNRWLARRRRAGGRLHADRGGARLAPRVDEGERAHLLRGRGAARALAGRGELLHRRGRRRPHR